MDEASALHRWKHNPDLFVIQAFGVTPEKWQIEALKNVALHDRISIRSGHGVGKTAYIAWIIIWWLLTRNPAKVACTAPTSSQLSDVLWGELNIWIKRLPESFQALLEWKSDRVEFVPDKGSYAVARTARREQPEAFQGYHSENMLFIVDEASGVDDIIFQVGEGAMSSHGAKTILTGNPTRTSGYFFDTHHKMRGYWKTMKVSCSDSTRVDPKQIERMASNYGVDSNVYRVRVLGDFPAVDDDAVIPLDLCEEALIREVDMIDCPIIWGVDVARFGDDSSALAKRQGNYLLEKTRVWKGKDTMQTSGMVSEEYNQALVKPDAIYIDSIGIGAGVVDRLKELGLPVFGVNVSESPAIAEKYMRLRDELWFNTREWLQKRDVRLADDEALIGELTAPRYGFTSSGKIKVEGKDEMKKRGVVSPNRADAFNLTFAGGNVRTRRSKLAYPYLGIS
jgi:phage terminase large subunit